MNRQQIKSVLFLFILPLLGGVIGGHIIKHYDFTLGVLFMVLMVIVFLFLNIKFGK